HPTVSCCSVTVNVTPGLRSLHAVGHELLAVVAGDALGLRVAGGHLVLGLLLLRRQARAHELLALVALLVAGVGVAGLHALLLRVFGQRGRRGGREKAQHDQSKEFLQGTPPEWVNGFVAARLPARPSGTREGFEAVYGKGNGTGNELR